jgi:hypothetical protein
LSFWFLRFIGFDRSLNWVHIGGVVGRRSWVNIWCSARTARARIPRPCTLNEDSAAVELLRTLNGMPLAITQAAAYIKRRARMTIAEYLSEFCANDKRRESLLNWDAGDLRRDESASNSVVTTWQISFERIQQ